MNPPVADAGQPVLVAFIHAVRTNFGGEAFEDVEEFLARAWAQCRIDGDPEWPDIREQVRDEWANSTSTEP